MASSLIYFVGNKLCHTSQKVLLTKINGCFVNFAWNNSWNCSVKLCSQRSFAFFTFFLVPDFCQSWLTINRYAFGCCFFEERWGWSLHSWFLGCSLGFLNLRICYWLSLWELGKHGIGEKYIFRKNGNICLPEAMCFRLFCKGGIQVALLCLMRCKKFAIKG